MSKSENQNPVNNVNKGAHQSCKELVGILKDFIGHPFSSHKYINQFDNGKHFQFISNLFYTPPKYDTDCPELKELMKEAKKSDIRILSCEKEVNTLHSWIDTNRSQIHVNLWNR